jgi:small subunit ribosomal protein S16
MLKIRLQRTGRKHEPTFRLVLTDSKNSTKSGKLLEVLGSHDSRHDKSTAIKGDRVKHWMALGAKASGTVHNLLITHKIITGKKVNVLPKKTVAKVEAPVEASPAPAPQAEVTQPEPEAPAQEAEAAPQVETQA